MKILLILILCISLSSAGFPSISSVFPYLFSKPTRRPHQPLPPNRKEFGRRSAELSPKEAAKKRKFHLQLAFGPIVYPNGLEDITSTTPTSFISSFYAKPATFHGVSSYYGELNDSEEHISSITFTTSDPFGTHAPITWRSTFPTYRTTTTPEPYESEEDIQPGGFTPKPTKKTTTTTPRPTTRAPYRTTKATTTTTEPYESEEEVLPGGFTTTPPPTTTVGKEGGFPIFEKLKERIPKFKDLKNILPGLPEAIRLPLLHHSKTNHTKSKGPLADIFPNWEDWTSLLPASIRIPRADEAQARQFLLEEGDMLPAKKSKKAPKPVQASAEARQITIDSGEIQTKKASRKKPKDTYVPPAITLMPPPKKPKATQPPRQKPKPVPVPDENEEDIQPGGQKPKSPQQSQTLEKFPAKPAGSLVDENEEDIQPGGQVDRGYEYGPPPAPKPPSKEIYFFVPPKEFNPKKPKPRPPVKPPLKPKKQVKVIFIKTPDPEPPIIPDIPRIPPHPEQKTVVYVVAKKPDKAPNVTIVLPKETKSPKPDVYFVRYQVTTTPEPESEEDIQPGGQKPKGYSYSKPTEPPESEEDIQPGGQTEAPPPKKKPRKVYLPPDESEEDIQPGGQKPTEPPPTYLPPKMDESEEDIQPGGQTEGPTTTTTMPTTTMPAESEEDIQPGGQTEGPTTTTMPTPAYLPPPPYLPPPKPNETEQVIQPGGQYPTQPSLAYLPLPPVVQTPPGGYPAPSGGYPSSNTGGYPAPTGGYPASNTGGYQAPTQGGYPAAPSSGFDPPPLDNTYLPHPPYYGENYGAPVSNFLNHDNKGHQPYFPDNYEDDDDEEESEEEDEYRPGGYSDHPNHHQPYGPQFNDPYGNNNNEWDRQLTAAKRKKKSGKKYGPKGYEAPGSTHFDPTQNQGFPSQFHPVQQQYEGHQSQGPRYGRGGPEMKSRKKKRKKYGRHGSSKEVEKSEYNFPIQAQFDPSLPESVPGLQQQFGQDPNSFNPSPYDPAQHQYDENPLEQQIYNPGPFSTVQHSSPNLNTKVTINHPTFDLQAGKFLQSPPKFQQEYGHQAPPKFGFQDYKKPPKFNPKFQLDHSPPTYSSEEIHHHHYTTAQTPYHQPDFPLKFKPTHYEPPKFSKIQSSSIQINSHGDPKINPQRENSPGIYTVDPLRLQHPISSAEPLTLQQPPRHQTGHGSSGLVDPTNYDPLRLALQELDGISPHLLSDDNGGGQKYNDYQQEHNRQVQQQIHNQQHHHSTVQHPEHQPSKFDQFVEHGVLSNSQNFSLPLSNDGRYQLPESFDIFNSNPPKFTAGPYSSKYYEPLDTPFDFHAHKSQQLQQQRPGVTQAHEQFHNQDYIIVQQQLREQEEAEKYNQLNFNPNPQISFPKYTTHHQEPPISTGHFKELPHSESHYNPAAGGQFGANKFGQNLFDLPQPPHPGQGPRKPPNPMHATFKDFNKPKPIPYNDNILFPSGRPFWNGNGHIEKQNMRPASSSAFSSIFESLGLTLG